MTLTPARLGQTVITVTATSADGRSGTAAFNVSVIGQVQAAINAAAPGGTIHLQAGTFVEHLFIDIPNPV